MDILVISICAMLCGAEDFYSIAEFGRAKESFFRRLLDLPNGIPSADTFARVFSLISARRFETCFRRWFNSFLDVSGKPHIAVDGKTVRRSHNRKAGQSAIHIVSAYASRSGLVLGQVKTEEKSNEITAIPELLDALALKGCLVTIDAMGCQKNIAAQIVDQQADYVLALKGNQSNLAQEVEAFFERANDDGFCSLDHDFHEIQEKGHGREETRRLWVTDQIEEIEKASRDRWEGLRSVIMLESSRSIGDEESVEYRYYITSHPPEAKPLLDAVRSHWGIENSVHWVLDMAFREDESRVRNQVAAENLSLLRKMALDMLKQDKTTKLGAKNKRLRAGWDEPYLLNLLKSCQIWCGCPAPMSELSRSRQVASSVCEVIASSTAYEAAAGRSPLSARSWGLFATWAMTVGFRLRGIRRANPMTPLGAVR
jgi:predicted transposase YbfD/YdcC